MADERFPQHPELESVRVRMAARIEKSITSGVLYEVRPHTIEEPSAAATHAVHCLLDYTDGRELILWAADLIREL